MNWEETVKAHPEIQCHLFPEDFRLHLQHGPIDIISHVEADQEVQKQLYSAALKRLASVLDELVGELNLLKSQWNESSVFPKGKIAQKMVKAIPKTEAYVTPMAAVAGAVADEILECMISKARAANLNRKVKKIYVNNGGDIALFLKPEATFSIGIVEQTDCPEIGSRIEIGHDSNVRGIATSGWRGRSESLGIADAVTVLARNAADADVAATLIANDVNVAHPGILRIPASEQKDDSDLQDLLVTVDVPIMPEKKVTEALEQGAETAKNFIQQGKIEAAYLSLQKQSHIIEKPKEINT